MNSIVIAGLFISGGVVSVLTSIFYVEKKFSKMSGKKIYNLKALREDIRRAEEKRQHASLTAAKRARRVKMRNESLASARAIRELVDGLDRDAGSAARYDSVPVIRVTGRRDGSTGR